MATDSVTITHPETKGTATVTRRAFDRAWSKRGWELVGDDLSKLKKDDLVALAEERGLDTTGTKDDLIARLETQES